MHACMQVYRAWTQDTFDIVRRRRRGPAAAFASEATAAEDDPTDESVRRRSGPMLRALPGVELCAELAALYTRVADGGDAPDEGGQGGEGGEWEFGLEECGVTVCLEVGQLLHALLHP